MKNPAEEIPVNIKYFLSTPSIFCFRVRNINVIPNKKKITIGNKKRRELLNNSLTAGMNNSHTITRNIPTNDQNVNNKDFLICIALQAF